MPSKGWSLQNLSDPLGSIDWFQGNDTEFAAESGLTNSYLAANNDNTGNVGSISDWAITPMRTYSNGDAFSFWTRIVTGSIYAGNLVVRMSTSGAGSDVGSNWSSLGDFTTLMLAINPSLVSNGYADVSTKYDLTITGLGRPTSGRIAFRCFVNDGGEGSGTNSNYIGIDTLTITTAVPEPSTYALAGIGAASVGLAGRQRGRD